MSVAKSGITSALEGFGLGEYEARAYVTLLRHSALTVSELAYHAGIPRTKTYATLRSLERKKLAALSRTKPVRCQALSPDEALLGAISEQERRLRTMRRTVLRLRQLREQAHQPMETQEQRYLVLGPSAMVSKLAELLAGARNTVLGTLDGWGFRLLCQALDAATTGGPAEFQLRVLRNLEFDSASEGTMPDVTGEVRYARLGVCPNFLLFDDETVLSLNSRTGLAVLIHSPDLHALLRDQVFRQLWEQGVPAQQSGTLMRLPGGEEAFDLLGSKEIPRIFARAVAEAVQEPSSLAAIGLKFVAGLEEALHVGVFRQPLEAGLPVLHELLALSLGTEGEVRFDPVTKILTIEAKHAGEGFPASMWLFALTGMLFRNGSSLKVLQNVAHANEQLHVLQGRIVPIPPTETRVATQAS